MARRKGLSSRRRKIVRAPRTPRRPRINRDPITRTKVTSPIVSATRSVVSLLPNAVQKLVSPLADFVFRGFGLATDLTVGKVKDSTVYFTGLSNGLFIRPCDLIAFSDRAVRVEASNIASGAQFQSNIAGVKTLSISARISNVAAASGKRGNWSAVIVWMNTPTDDGMWKSKALTFRDISDLPNARTASCCQDLFLMARPPVMSFASSTVGLDKTVALLFVAYECLDRSGYAEFTSDDFGTTISLSGSFKVTEWMPNNLAMTAGYKMNSVLDSSAVILDQAAHDKKSVLQTKRFIVTLSDCKKTTDGTACIVSGDAVKADRSILSLDEMAIDE